MDRYSQDYLIQLIIDAKDNFSSKLSDLRREISGLEKDFDDLNKKDLSLGPSDSSVSKSKRNIKDIENTVKGSAKNIEQYYDQIGDGAADAFKDAYKKQEDTAEAFKRSNEKRRKDEIAAEKKKADDINKILTDSYDLSEKQREEYLKAEKAARDRAVQLAKEEADELNKILDDRAANWLKTQNDMAAEEKRILRDRQRVQDQLTLDQIRNEQRENDALKTRQENLRQLTELEKSVLAVRQKIKDGLLNNEQGATGLDQLSSAIKSKGKGLFEAGSDKSINLDLFVGSLKEEARTLRGELDKTDTSIHRTRKSFRDIINSGDSFVDKLKDIDHQIKINHSNISRLDNSLRGLIVFGALIFVQQLATGLTVLAGAATSAATAVVSAAGAIGGALVSAAGQAIPVAAALGAAFYRMQNISDALKKSRQVAQQDYANAAKDANKEESALDAVANANEQLKIAQDRLSDSKENQRDATNRLSLARANARDELRELINTEKEAQLAAQGAVLSQEDAQRKLRAATLSGDVLGTQQAQLDLEDSDINVSKAQIAARKARQAANSARAGGLNNLPDVKAARDNLRSANREMVAASLAAQKAQQGIDKAARSSAIATSNITAARGALNYLLDTQLTEPEKKLYSALDRLWKKADEVSGDLAEPLIESFTYVAERSSEILGDKSLYESFLATSNVVANEVRNVFDGVINQNTLEQVKIFSNEANRNLPILSRAITQVIRGLLNIGVAFAPNLRMIVDWAGDLADNFEKATKNQEGLNRTVQRTGNSLTSIKDLVVSLGGLFAALWNTTALEEGNGLIDSITKNIIKLTDYVNGNGDSVNKFFRDSADSTRILGGMVLNLVKGLAQIYDPQSLQATANFFNKILIPGIVEAAKSMGTFIEIIDKFLSAIPNEMGYKIAALAIQLALLSKALQSVFAVAGRLGTLVLFKPFIGAATIVGRTAIVMKELATAIGLVITAGSGQRLLAIATGFEAIKAAATGATVAAAAATGTSAAAGAGGAAAGRLAAVKGVARKVAPIAIGYGAYKALPNEPESIGGLTDESRYGSLNFGAQYAKLAVDNVINLRFRSLLKQLNPFGQGGATAGRAKAELTSFGKTAEQTFDRLAKANDKVGLNRLADQATRLAEKYPTAAEVLNDFAASARNAAKDAGNAAREINKLNEAARTKREKGANSDFQVGTYENSLAALRGSTGSIGQVREQLNKTLDNVNGAYKIGSVGNIDERAKTFNAAIKAIRSGIKAGNIDADEGYRELSKIVERQSNNIGNNLKKGSEEGRAAYQQNLRKMIDATKEAMDANVITTDTGRQRINRIIRQMAKVSGVKLEGEERVQAGGDKNSASGTSYGPHNVYAAGGWVGNRGERGKDNVAMVGRGEAVLNHDHQGYVDEALQRSYGFNLDGLFKKTSSLHAGSPIGLATGGYAGLKSGIGRLARDTIERFPGLSVTSTTGGTHAKNSYHYRGLAADIGGPVDVMRAAADWIRKTAGASLLEGIHNPNLSVKSGKTVPSSFWGGSTWGGHKDHIHIALAGGGDFQGLLGGGSGGFDRKEYNRKIREVLKQVKTAGQFGRIGVAGLSRVSKLAGDRLEKLSEASSSEGVESGSGLTSAGGQYDKSELKRLWKRAGGPEKYANIAAAIALAESGGNPGAQNSIGATGLWQILRSAHPTWNAGGNLKDPLWNAKAAVAISSKGTNWNPWTVYTGADTPNNEKTYLRYLAKGGKLDMGPRGTGYDVGGVIPGTLGAAKMIMAHAGEAVLTPKDVETIRSIILKLSGVDAGKSITTLGAKSTGLGTGLSRTLGLDALVQNRSLQTAVKANRSGLADLEGITYPGSKKGAPDSFIDALTKNGDKLISKYYDSILKGIKGVVDEGGTLDQVRARIDKSSSLRKVREVFRRYKQNGNTTSFTDSLSGDAVGQAEREVNSQAQDFEDLVTERQQIDRTYKEIDTEYDRSVKDLANLVSRRNQTSKKDKAKRKKLNDAITKQRKRVNNLATAKNNITDRREDSDEALSASIQSQAEAQAALEQSRVDAVSSRYDTANANLDATNRRGLNAGLSSVIRGVIGQRINFANNQIAELSGLLSSTQDASVRKTIEDKIRELSNSIEDSIVELFNSASDELKESTARGDFYNDLQRRFLTAGGTLGLNGPNPNTGRALGNFGNFTRLTVAEGTLAQRQQDESRYYRLLEDAVRTFGYESKQAKQAEQDYWDNLADQAEAARDIREIKINDAFEQRDRRLTTLDKQSQIAVQNAQINGADQNAARLPFLQQRGSELANFGSALNGLLTMAINAADDEEAEKLRQAILDNQIAINENTLELKKVNGAENAQAFSTTSWQRFRQAIFNGSNGLLPAYGSYLPSMASGGTIEQDGFVRLHAGETVVPAKITRQINKAYTDSALELVRFKDNLESINNVNSNVNKSNSIVNNNNININEAGRRDDLVIENLLNQINTPQGR